VKKNNTITYDDWQAALSQVGYGPTQNDQTARTLQELKAMWGLGKTAATTRLRRLIEAGLVTQTYKVVTAIDGRPSRIVAYKLTKV
jgi:hypothetical protein